MVKKREDLRDRREALTNRIQQLLDDARSHGERGNVAAAREAVEKADECTVSNLIEASYLTNYRERKSC